MEKHFKKLKQFFLQLPKREKQIYFGTVGILMCISVWIWGITPILPVVDPFNHSVKTCRIDAYGASKENASETREAFKKAFADCAPGGTVVVPWGTWKTGGITVPSEVTLSFNLGSTLSFSDDTNDYLPVVATRWEGMDVMNFQPLLYIPNAKNVAIIGHGILVGNGEKWWKWRNKKSGVAGEQATAEKLYEMAKNNVPIAERTFGSDGSPLRPSFLQFFESENVVLDGITLIDGPMWTIHPVYSKNVTIRNVKVVTTAPNTDGIAIDSSENVLVTDSEIGSGDDAIVLKSGLDYDGWKQNRPTKNVVIQNSRVVRGNAGVTIGSEMSGGIEDVLVKNMKFSHIDTGIRLKTLKGRGGYVRNIRYENIDMRDLAEDAIQFDMKYKYATLESGSDALPTVENLTLKNITARDTNRAFRIGGVEEMPIKNLSLENCSFFTKTLGKVNDIIDSQFKNVSVSPDDQKPISITNVKNTSFTGRFPHGGRGDLFAKFQGSGIENVTIHIAPCPRNACISQDAKVPVGAIRFE